MFPFFKEEEARALREEGARRYQEEKERSIAVQKDHELAMFTQLQLDKEYERERVRFTRVAFHC